LKAQLVVSLYFLWFYVAIWINNSAFEKVENINKKINTLKTVFILKNNYSDVLYLLLLMIITNNIGRINVKSVTTINKIPSSE